MANFALIGAAGYIAPRHLKAIADTHNDLLAAYDKFDSVGRLDSFFPDCSFFTEQEQFDRFCSKQQHTDKSLQWLSICTPNYTHDAFIRYGLRLGCNVICEKPLVLNPYNIDNLVDMEKSTGHQAYTILQLRLHDSIVALKKKVESGPKDHKYDVDLTYITSRGKWYYSSWKGDVHKSGGIATNIGVHFYDMLQWIFGPVEQNIVHVMSHDRVAGFLEFKQARVRYFLSINADCLPEKAAHPQLSGNTCRKWFPHQRGPQLHPDCQRHSPLYPHRTQRGLPSAGQAALGSPPLWLVRHEILTFSNSQILSQWNSETLRSSTKY